MNAEFQRIAKRDKKAFLSEQMQREENNRMRKAKNLIKKIKDSQGTALGQCAFGADEMTLGTRILQ